MQTKTELNQETILEIKKLLVNKVMSKDICEKYNLLAEELVSIRKLRKFKDIGSEYNETIKQLSGGKLLTKEQVLDIKRLLNKGEMKNLEIANKFKVTSALISLIKSGKRYGDYTEVAVHYEPMKRNILDNPVTPIDGEKWCLLSDIEDIEYRNGFENYAISTLGRLKTIRKTGEYLMSLSKTNRGYLKICIRKKSFRIHRLVAMAFIDNPQNKPEVNHMNCIKDDNTVGNLEWVTGEENIEHAMKMGKIQNKKHK